MIDFGTEKTITNGDGFSIIEIQKIKKGEIYASLRQYKIRVNVSNSQEEMTEFIKFTDEVRSRREDGKLFIDKHDPSTFPTFTIEYPKTDLGTYFIIKSYTIVI